MNRLQKKCVLATAGVHLLLLVILMVGPAFFEPRPKADDLQVLDVIPANLIDAPFTSGVRNAQPPPPAPVVTPPAPQPPPTPPPPKPVEPTPTLTERLEKMFKPEPPKPAPEKVQPAQNSNQHQTRDPQHAQNTRPGQFCADERGPCATPSGI